jgi:hypothetical protein
VSLRSSSECILAAVARDEVHSKNNRLIIMHSVCYIKTLDITSMAMFESITSRHKIRKNHILCANLDGFTTEMYSYLQRKTEGKAPRNKKIVPETAGWKSMPHLFREV